MNLACQTDSHDRVSACQGADPVQLASCETLRRIHRHKSLLLVWHQQSEAPGSIEAQPYPGRDLFDRVTDAYC
jgi:hypothetical protein